MFDETIIKHATLEVPECEAFRAVFNSLSNLDYSANLKAQ